MTDLAKENEQLKTILRHLLPDRIPDIFFICGASGDKDSNGLPQTILVCPAYGCDFFVAYEKVSTHDDTSQHIVKAEDCRTPACRGCGRHIGHPHHEHCRPA